MTPQEKDKKYIWHPFTSLEPDVDPILIDSAEGAFPWFVSPRTNLSTSITLTLIE
jgi:adenosylmethionine-8-amino-7-oxononanoate aminotransferase